MSPRKPFFFALFATFLQLAACEAPAPTDVAEAPRHSTSQGITLLSVPAGRALAPAGQTSETIGPEGGVIELQGARLTIPAGALREPVTITLKGRLDGLYRYRFGPNGLHFLVPANLQISVDPEGLGVPPEAIEVATAPDGSDDWTLLHGVYDPPSRTVSVAVPHFTEYALCTN